ncbi:uncharacterized protein LOC135501632 [Lineus longissimus]|uniref:uncharacterized protein LOC135501632 n=1 Tax=Lineus longissimus TaxID=88925 RepID=UPI00315CD270
MHVQNIEKILKQKARLDQSKKVHENEREMLRKKRKRGDPSYRKTESLQKRTRYMEKKCNKQTDQTLPTCPTCNITELSSEMSSYQKKKYGVTLKENIDLFLNLTAEGPIYICTCCHQTWFRHSVKSSESWPKLFDSDFVKSLLTEKTSVDGKRWLCNTCVDSLKSGKVPKLAVANGMKFPATPPELLDLYQLEERLIALRIPFMQIRQLPRGSQLSMKGSVVNVPTDVENTVNSLPRTLDKTCTIPIKLKRKLSYTHAVITQNVRPAVIISALYYLMNNSELYKNANLTVNDGWLQSFPAELVEEETPICEANINNPNNASSVDTLVKEFEEAEQFNPDDHFEEIQDDTPGNLDTLLDEPEISNSYVYSFAPGENQRPLGLFQDKDSEYLCFPSIFIGQRRPDNEERRVPVHYSDISPPDDRTFLIKSTAELEKLPPNSTDIKVGNIISRYSTRPKQLESWCLADYASKLNITYPKQNNDPFKDNLDDVNEDFILNLDTENMQADNDENEVNFTTNSGVVYKLKKNPKVIRYVRYNVNTDPENCYRERILLFLPWRNETSDLLGGHSTHYAHYNAKKSIIDIKRKQYEHMADILDEAAKRAETESQSFDGIAPGNMHTEAEDADQTVHDCPELAFFNPANSEQIRTYDIGVDIGLHPQKESHHFDKLPGRISDEEYHQLVMTLNIVVFY